MDPTASGAVLATSATTIDPPKFHVRSPAESEFIKSSEMDLDAVPEVPYPPLRHLRRATTQVPFAKLRRPTTQDLKAFWYCSPAKWERLLAETKHADKRRRKTASNHIRKYDAVGRIMETAAGKPAPVPCRSCSGSKHQRECRILEGNRRATCALCRHQQKSGCTAGIVDASRSSSSESISDEPSGSTHHAEIVNGGELDNASELYDDGKSDHDGESSNTGGSDEIWQCVSPLDHMVSDKLHEIQEKPQRDHGVLKDSHAALQHDHWALEETFRELQERHQALQEDHNALREELVALRRMHQERRENDRDAVREAHQLLREDQQALQISNRALVAELQQLQQRVSTHDSWLEWFKADYYTAARDVYMMWKQLWPSSTRAPPEQPTIL